MKVIHTFGLSTLLTLCLCPIYAIAQDTDEDALLLSYGDEELISIATGKIQPIYKAPAVATVITAEQIESMGATDLDQVLESVPGLHVSISSNRGSPIYAVRGIHTDKNPQILVLINGSPMTQLLLGDRGVASTLSVNHIARVEVIRGPGSAIYGADAFSGVINVITKNAANIDGTETGIRLGSFNTKEIWYSYGSNHKDWDIFFGLEASKSDGDSDRIITLDAQSAFDAAFPNNPVSRAPGPLNTGYQRLDFRFEVSNDQWTFRAWNWRQREELVAGVASALDPEGESKVDNYLFDITYEGSNSSKTWEYETKLSYMDINTEAKQKLFPAGTILPIGVDGNVSNINPTLVRFSDGLIGNPQVNESHSKLDFISYFSGVDKHLIRLATGVSYAQINGKEDKNFGPGVLDNPSSLPGTPFPVVDGTLTNVTNTDFIFIQDENRTVEYLSIQDEWSLTGDWALTVGVRYDKYSDFGSTTNPRIALVWDVQRNLTTKLLYGKAFRAPSLAELFAINNPVILGNPNLDPEVIDTYEIAFDYHPRFDLNLGVNIFYYELDELIEFVEDQGLNSQTAQNVGTQSGHGFEVEFDWTIKENLSVSGHYAYQNSEDERNNVDSGNAPEQQVYLNLKWKFSTDWFASTQAYWVGDRNREFNDTRDQIDDYSLMNLTVGCNCFIPELDLSFSVRNLFDKKAYEPSPVEAGPFIPGDYPLEGRNAYFRAHYRF